MCTVQTIASILPKCKANTEKKMECKTKKKRITSFRDGDGTVCKRNAKANENMKYMAGGNGKLFDDIPISNVVPAAVARHKKCMTILNRNSTRTII